MTVTTAVPQPTFGPNGFIAPSEQAILAGVQADIQAAFTLEGYTLNPSLATPQGQLASSMAAEIGNVNDTFLYQSTQTDPDFVVGRWQDAIGRIYFIERIAGVSTVLNIACVGLPGVVIPAGTLLQDAFQNQYYSISTATIPTTGTVTVTFAAVIPGPTAVPSSVVIFQGISGWDTATITSGTVGSATEGRAAFEARRYASVAVNAIGSLPCVLGAVLSVPNVIDAYVTDNSSNTTAIIGGVQLQSNSIFVCVVGGLDSDVAFAIWSKKAPGCGYNGNTTVTVLDQSTGYVPPYPAYAVTFQRPIELQIIFSVVITNNISVPANYITLIQIAIINAFAGLDGGPRQVIGTTVYASRFYAPVIALGTWVQLVDIQIGSANNATVQFTGGISGATLSVGTVLSGAIAVGQTLADFSGNIAPGTTILSGLGASWIVSVTQTVSIEQMFGVNAYLYDEFVNINQNPVVSAQNISVSFG